MCARACTSVHSAGESGGGNARGGVVKMIRVLGVRGGGVELSRVCGLSVGKGLDADGG